MEWHDQWHEFSFSRRHISVASCTLLATTSAALYGFAVSLSWTKLAINNTPRCETNEQGNHNFLLLISFQHGWSIKQCNALLIGVTVVHQDGHHRFHWEWCRRARDDDSTAASNLVTDAATARRHHRRGSHPLTLMMIFVVARANRYIFQVSAHASSQR